MKIYHFVAKDNMWVDPALYSNSHCNLSIIFYNFPCKLGPESRIVVVYAACSQSEATSVVVSINVSHVFVAQRIHYCMV
jgi:hypothetical protein